MLGDIFPTIGKSGRASLSAGVAAEFLRRRSLPRSDPIGRETALHFTIISSSPKPNTIGRCTTKNKNAYLDDLKKILKQ